MGVTHHGRTYRLDVQADGGTHVASTAQIGKVTVVKVESKGKANRRVRVRIAD
jgi:misacylated tRNA(Ala) deacylase